MDTQGTLQAILNTISDANRKDNEIMSLFAQSDLGERYQELNESCAKNADLADELERDLLDKLRAGESMPECSQEDHKLLDNWGFWHLSEVLRGIAQP